MLDPALCSGKRGERTGRVMRGAKHLGLHQRSEHALDRVVVQKAFERMLGLGKGGDERVGIRSGPLVIARPQRRARPNRASSPRST